MESARTTMHAATLKYSTTIIRKAVRNKTVPIDTGSILVLSETSVVMVVGLGSVITKLVEIGLFYPRVYEFVNEEGVMCCPQDGCDRVERTVTVYVTRTFFECKK